MSRRPTRRRFLQLAAAGTGILGIGARHAAHASESGPNRLAGLDGYVEQSMVKWEVPGVAIAVVHNGERIHARGYGICGLGAEAKVDAETIFAIASCTKAFAAAALAKLIDDSMLSWDDPIVKYLPEFQLASPKLTANVTIRQALAHRTGLPNANMLWRSGALGGDEILSRLRWLEPVAAPGERFLYNNNMYLVLGRIVEQISGQKWAAFLHDSLLAPLGMKSTVADRASIRGHHNLAAPHASDFGKLERIPPHCPDVIAPAGAIHSNVLDLAAWLTMHLDGGQFRGQTILTKARVDELLEAPQGAEAKDDKDDKKGTSAASRVPRAPLDNYGLGWFFNKHAGRRVVEHSGTQNGFVSWVAMIPEERLGLVVLANHHRTGLNSALRSRILDAFLGQPPRDWSEEVRADYTNGYQRLLREAKANFAARRPPAAQPPRPLPEYAGDYESRLYGRLSIQAKQGGLVLKFGTRFEGELTHWEHDSFRVTFANPRLDDWLLRFTTNGNQVTSVHVKESPWAPDWYDDADDLGDFVRS